MSLVVVRYTPRTVYLEGDAEATAVWTFRLPIQTGSAVATPERFHIYFLRLNGII